MKLVYQVFLYFCVGLFIILINYPFSFISIWNHLFSFNQVFFLYFISDVYFMKFKCLFYWYSGLNIFLMFKSLYFYIFLNVYLWNVNRVFYKTALHLASLKGHIEIVQLLLSQPGIDINCKTIIFQKSSIQFLFSFFNIFPWNTLYHFYWYMLKFDTKLISEIGLIYFLIFFKTII